MDELQNNFHKQLAAVNNSWENFRYVRDKNSEWLQLAAIANMHSNVGYKDFLKLVGYIPAPASQKVLFNLAKLMQETIKRNCDYSWFRGECFNNKVLSWYSEYFKGASNFEKIAMLRCCGALLCAVDNPTYEMMLEAVKSCGYAIDFIKNPSHELMAEAVKNNPNSIAYIDGPVPEDIISIVLSEYPYLLDILIGQVEMPISEELQLSALNKLLSEKGVGNVDEGVFKVLGSKRLQIYEETGYLLDLSSVLTTEAAQLEAVKKDGFDIQYIKDPSEAVQLEAVKRNGYAIQFIKNPSEDVQLAAVKSCGNAVYFIKNPSEVVQLTAVENVGGAIRFIKNPSEDMLLAAVKRNGYAIGCIKSPSEVIQIEAVRSVGYSIEYIESPSEAVQMEAVKRNGGAIQYIKNPSEAVQLAAVKSDASAIEYIKNPSKAVQLAAECSVDCIKNSSEDEQLEVVKKDGRVIQYIENPSEAVQLAAVRSVGSAIQYIKKPPRGCTVRSCKALW